MNKGLINYLKNTKLDKVDTALSFYFVFLSIYTIIFFITSLLEKYNFFKYNSLDDFSDVLYMIAIPYFVFVIIGLLVFPIYTTLKTIDITKTKSKERNNNITKLVFFISGAILCIFLWIIFLAIITNIK